MDFFIKQQYIRWQKTHIETSYGPYTRAKIISIFVREGLFPLINNNGYTLTKNILQMEDILATMLFKYTLNKNHIFRVSNGNSLSNLTVQYDYYCNRIDYEVWGNFWKDWKPFIENIFFYDEGFCGMIEHLIWECIDLKKSSTYLEYLEENYESDNESKIKTDDPYILDQFNRAIYDY